MTMADSEKSESKTVRVEMYKGGETPVVDINDGDDLWIEIPDESEVSGYSMSPGSVDRFNQSIGISLKSLRLDVHNQSYGMISASTGCISNPGGPGC
jgi:hypothetical protein